MKNNIIIRIENTMFNTKNIENHLPKAKDKNDYVNTSLPKCKVNNNLLEINELLSKIADFFNGGCSYILKKRNNFILLL